MRSLILLILLLIVLLNQNYAQTDSSMLQFYPIEIGNVWQYESTTSFPEGDIFHRIKTVTILGDTLLQNGKSYRIFEENIISMDPDSHTNNERWIYRRVDTLNMKVYEYYPYFDACEDSERVFLDLLLLNYSGWSDCSAEVIYDISFAEYESVGNLSFYNRDQINYEGNTWIGLRSFSKDFGLALQYSGELMMISDILIYAKIDGIEYGTIINNIENGNRLPEEYFLSQNYPNPFNPTTKIKFTIPTSPFNPSPYQGEGNTERLTSLIVYDILGREVKTLLNKYLSPGNYEIEFDATDLPSGIYFYKLSSDNFTETKKMMLMK